MKTCTKCGIEKDESEFYKGRGGCKSCYCKAAMKWCEKNPEKAKNNHSKNSKKWSEKNHEKVILMYKKWREKSDRYQMELICRKHQITKTEVTHEMIRLKKIELENKRLLKQLKNETK